MKSQHIRTSSTLIVKSYLALGLRRGVGKEWRLAYEHLVEDDTNTPPVAHLRVAGPGKHFRSDVIGSTDEGMGEASQVLAPPPSLKGLEVVAATHHVVIDARIHRLLTGVLACRDDAG